MSIIFNGHYRMKHRTWITEALRLHFEEHLPRVVAGRRLGVPKSTVCSMFVRFRRAGLSWPLPAGMSEQELDACLYGQFSTVPVVRPESTVISEAPVVKKRPRRPNFPYEFKIALVEQSRKRLVRTVLIFTESSDQLSRATDRVPGLPASPGYVQ